MTLTIKLVAFLAFATLSLSIPLKFKEEPETEYPPQKGLSISNIDTYQLPLALQLPKQEPNQVPFLAPEPSTYLKAPEENQEFDYYQVPIPNQDLIAPVDTPWNPDNDPKLYFEVPAIITKQEVPTQEFPKKFNEDIHQKKKPYSLKPKEEIVFVPIDEQQYEEKQKQLDKTLDKLAKKENQKIIKAQQAV